MMNCLDRCFIDFSTSWRTVKIMSEHPHPSRKTHCDCGNPSSANFCNLAWITLAITFPTTSSRAIPRRLSHTLRSPFLGMGMRFASPPTPLHKVQQQVPEAFLLTSCLHHVREYVGTAFSLAIFQLAQRSSQFTH